MGNIQRLEAGTAAGHRLQIALLKALYVPDRKRILRSFALRTTTATSMTSVLKRSIFAMNA